MKLKLDIDNILLKNNKNKTRRFYLISYYAKTLNLRVCLRIRFLCSIQNKEAKKNYHNIRFNAGQNLGGLRHWSLFVGAKLQNEKVTCNRLLF